MGGSLFFDWLWFRVVQDADPEMGSQIPGRKTGMHFA